MESEGDGIGVEEWEDETCMKRYEHFFFQWWSTVRSCEY